MRNIVVARLLTPVALGCLAALTSRSAKPDTPAAPVVVAKTSQGARLLRRGMPYFVKGVGGDASKERLKAAGGNSWRTWGADGLDAQLAQAQRLGMTVTAGIWFGHKDAGFNYHDPAAVAAQLESVRKTVLRYRDSPALLVWALGNEMETGQESDPAVWAAIEDAAALVKKLDPHHPTMTVIAEIGANGDKVSQINAHCPDIDIIGINSYGGAPTLAARYKAAGGVKPYIVTEFGPAGWWEVGKNAWGASIEPTSTTKAGQYRASYEHSIAGQPLCLGSYAFLWGTKQEGTPTWFGTLLPNGDRLGTDDILADLWEGKPPVDRCPAIASLGLAEGAADQVAPGTTLHLDLATADSEHRPLTVRYELQYDPLAAHIAGGGEAAPQTFPDAVTASDASHVTVKMPPYGGAYRLYAYVRDDRGGAATANLPLFVKGNTPLSAQGAPKVTLPFVIYGPGAAADNYVPSGYEGNYGAIHQDLESKEMPRAGHAASLKAQYTAGDAWGGVLWQNPANDWGDKPGGWNLTGAKKLTFWARGERGGEVVTFLVGSLKGKPYSDSADGSRRATLTKDWKPYAIDLTGKDLSRIKTGFGWTAAPTGAGVTFWVDDVRFE